MKGGALEVALGLEIVWLPCEVERLFFFVDLPIDYVWKEPTMPLAGDSVEGIEESEVGRGAFRNKSYKVPD